MRHTLPEMSVLLVIGARRERAQRVLDALDAQTRADALEVVVIDLAAEGAPPLRRPGRVPMAYIPLPPTTAWGAARAVAVRRAQAELLAFVEDHCYPHPGWAEALLEAHRGPWAAVGYAFTNPNPDRYLARAAMFADYGIWAHPARTGPARLLPYNNVSYRRAALLALGDRLEQLLGSDFHVHRELSRRGLPMYVEGRALAAHENFTRLGSLLRANHHYARLLAADRVRNGRWGGPRRFAWGVGTLVVAPLISLGRRLGSLPGRRAVWGEAAAALPVLVVAAAWTGVGESLGYLLGPGTSGEEMRRWEVHAERGPPP
jgi:hypothetical protein